ncbi:MAG TPA: zinc ABC transporter ATP-binding protein, partial [Porphyromonadaceae bacterium]|nr:zinc ABC transporter ATP-binding protein [Porphyromonadaceae bacterium]
MNKLLEIQNLTVGYDAKPEVLKGVSLSVYERDFLGIIGPNGGGKTTLLKTILGLIKPSVGTITFFDEGRSVPDINIGYLPQINQIDKKFPISVSQVILSGLTPSGRLFKRYTLADREQVKRVAGQLGIEPLLDKPIGELSGGQLQRVLLGRAII